MGRIFYRQSHSSVYFTAQIHITSEQTAMTELSDARAKLKTQLDKIIIQEDLFVPLANWFNALKEWEKNDGFESALKDRRMTARVTDVWGVRREYTGRKGTPDFFLRPGLIGVKHRLLPDNFDEKYDRGLHTVPAVLLNPGFNITSQLFCGPFAYCVFMPLPPQEDLQIYNQLKSFYGMNKLMFPELSADLYDRLVHIRRRMTRIHLANEKDMGAAYGAFTKTGKSNRTYSLKYGFHDVTSKAFDKSKTDTFRDNALFYQDKLKIELDPLQKANLKKLPDSTADRNNEVTIKYRQHDGHFPLFTRIRWNEAKDKIVRFDELKKWAAFPGATRQVSDNGKLKTIKGGPLVWRVAPEIPEKHSI
jgi:hypothetical protein